MDLDEILAKLPKDEEEYLRSLIEKDSLTGAYNRRKFDEDIKIAVSRAGKGEELSLLMIDVDHFKKYNDTKGHQEGDRVLKEVAKFMMKDIAECLKDNLRGFDPVYRYGGEEFAVILPKVNAETASFIAERLRAGVMKSCSVTVSIGVSAYTCAGDGLQEQIIKTADQALFKAKENGRNNVVYKGPEDLKK